MAFIRVSPGLLVPRAGCRFFQCPSDLFLLSSAIHRFLGRVLVVRTRSSIRTRSWRQITTLTRGSPRLLASARSPHTFSIVIWISVLIGRERLSRITWHSHGTEITDGSFQYDESSTPWRDANKVENSSVSRRNGRRHYGPRTFVASCTLVASFSAAAGVTTDRHVWAKCHIRTRYSIRITWRVCCRLLITRFTPAAAWSPSPFCSWDERL